MADRIDPSAGHQERLFGIFLRLFPAEFRERFAGEMRTLFRDNPDRTSMLFAFDLHVHEEVRDNAAAILQRLNDGTMPCDGAWPPERIALFQQWVDSGSAP